MREREIMIIMMMMNMYNSLRGENVQEAEDRSVDGGGWVFER